MLYLIDAEAADKGVKLTFYDPNEDVMLEINDYNYRPYLFLPHPISLKEKNLIEETGGNIESVYKKELFTGELKILTKVTVEDIFTLKSISKRFRVRWEDDIPLELSYVYDKNLTFGALHYVSKGNISLLQEIPDDLKNLFEEKFVEIREKDPKKYSLILKFFSLCSQPIPEISPARLGLAGRFDEERLYLTFMLARVANLPLSMASISGKVSVWIRSLLHAYMRRENILIPRPIELARGEKFRRIRGGLTMPPESGIHFNTVVVDFESLYPSIIDAYNLSYETIDCGHNECMKNTVPGTNHYVCTKRRGIYSILIGALKDLRIKWFKPISRDKSIPENERRLAAAAAKLLKLILVASYGVTVRIPGLAQPALAESITAYGRHSLIQAWNIAKHLGLHPIYGDTDSLFLENPPENVLQNMIKIVKDSLRLDLAIDKRYSICVLPKAMKAYFGIMDDGTPDIKGLAVIKSNSPVYTQKVFARCIKELMNVKNWEEFESAKERIRNIVRNAIEDLRLGKVPIKDLEYVVKIHFNPYEKRFESDILHQPYQCAIQLINNGVKVRTGDEVRFIKVKPFKYLGKTFTVKPTFLVKGIHEVNIDEYIKGMISALNQTFKPMGLSFYQPIHKDLSEFI